MHLHHTVYKERQTSQSGQVSKQRWIASWAVVANIFHVHPPIWGRFSNWLIFFKWVETTTWLVFSNIGQFQSLDVKCCNVDGLVGEPKWHEWTPKSLFLDHATLDILPLPTSHLRARFNAIWVIPNSWYVTMRIYFQAQGQDPGSDDGWWKIWSSEAEEWILL